MILFIFLQAEMVEKGEPTYLKSKVIGKIEEQAAGVLIDEDSSIIALTHDYWFTGNKWRKIYLIKNNKLELLYKSEEPFHFVINGVLKDGYLIIKDGAIYKFEKKSKKMKEIYSKNKILKLFGFNENWSIEWTAYDYENNVIYGYAYYDDKDYIIGLSLNPKKSSTFKIKVEENVFPLGVYKDEIIGYIGEWECVPDWCEGNIVKVSKDGKITYSEFSIGDLFDGDDGGWWFGITYYDGEVYIIGGRKIVKVYAQDLSDHVVGYYDLKAPAITGTVAAYKDKKLVFPNFQIRSRYGGNLYSFYIMIKL